MIPMLPYFGITKDKYSIPKYKINENSIAPNIAYRMIKDELMNEGNARLNLATFCQTYMEDKATKLMAETLQKMLSTSLNIHKLPK